MGENTELGKTTYEAYCEFRELNGGGTFPKWDDLTPNVRTAWVIAGEAATRKALSQIAPQEPS